MNRLDSTAAAAGFMGASLHIYHTCPFCWKVRALVRHLNLPVTVVQVNPFRVKKEIAFADDWGKVPVWREGDGTVVVDSTPIMKHIDATHNNGGLYDAEDARQNEWMAWVDTHLSKATVPLLYGSLGSALSTTRRISKVEKFNWFSKRLYAWAGFPVMWGIIAKKRVKADGRTPKQRWHDLLGEFTDAFEGQPFFGGEAPDLVDLAAYGYMRSCADYPQFDQLRDHTAGMAWYNAVAATLHGA
ncbi:MAG: glutathione S-transferase [Candidatus Poseidoniales archaeon]|nr:MAG: glutathione S-transferase [Candidatus Poseidoniales archaeon]